MNIYATHHIDNFENITDKLFCSNLVLRGPFVDELNVKFIKSAWARYILFEMDDYMVNNSLSVTADGESCKSNIKRFFLN